MERIRLIAYKVENGLSVRNSHFGHRFPPGYNSWFQPKVLRCIRMWRSTKAPTVVTTAAYLKTNRGIQRKRRITRGLDTRSTPITTIARLRLCTRSNTVALHINKKRRTNEGETRTHSGIGYLMQRITEGLVRTYGVPTLF
jgi:hypothetical protein